MRLLLYLIFFIALFPASTSAMSFRYAEQKCRQIYLENPPEIAVKYNYGDLKYDFSKTRDELAKINKEVLGVEKNNLRGLTSLEPNIKIEGLQLRGEGIDDAKFCVYPVKIEVSVAMNPIIYLDKSLKKGTCEYKVTLRHEYTHIDIGHTALNLLVKALNRQLPEFAATTAVRVMSPDEIADKAEKLNQDFQQKVLMLWQIFINTLNQQHELLDTPENYKRETSLCR
ncbi:MAG: hypothetical protein IJ778_01305 [Alphaproteobacteria bacterium]|nr:hypothetical protein [Alphaproteobacteria bacterium]